jgi:molybdate transport system substrate-binding protein
VKLLSKLKTKVIIPVLTLLCITFAACGCQLESSLIHRAAEAKNEDTHTLLIYAAGGLREAVEETAAHYKLLNQDKNIEIKLVYNSSGRLLAHLALSSEGDLYISSDDYFMQKAAASGLVNNCAVVAQFIPVIVVPAGNPANIDSLADLALPGIKVILADDAAAMGRAARQILSKNALEEAVRKNVIATVSTAPQVVLALVMGQADAGITGINSTGELAGKVDIISIPARDNAPTSISAGVLTASSEQTLAADFISFMLSPVGQGIFTAHDFGPAENMASKQD